MFCHINRQIISVKIGFFIHEITFRTKFTVSNFLLLTFLTGGKWYFEGANLLLATGNFKPWVTQTVDNKQMVTVGQVKVCGLLYAF